MYTYMARASLRTTHYYLTLAIEYLHVKAAGVQGVVLNRAKDQDLETKQTQK